MKPYQQKLLVLLLLPASGVMAEKNGVAFDLAATTQMTDNARKQEVDKVSEQQNIYNLLVNANYANDWLLLNSNYDASKQTYEKDSQVDRNMLEGTTELTLGGPYDPASLLLTHTRRSLLGAPDAIDLARNRDERDIVMAKPMLRWRIDGADALVLSGNFSKVSYRVDDTKDSEQSGGQLAWIRKLSPIDRFELVALQHATKFDGAPDANYEYQSVGALYSVQLNHFGYSIQAGENRALPNADETSSTEESYSHPTYNIEATYNTGLNTIKLLATQLITDSSMGNGNRQSFGENSQLSSGVGIDLINLRTLEFSWSSMSLCDRCTLEFNATKHIEDYQVLDEDGNEKSIGGGLSYKMSRFASIHVNIGRMSREFSPTSSRVDYKSTRGRISYEYDFINELKLKIFVQNEQRDSAGDTQNYDERVTGLSISYGF